MPPGTDPQKVLKAVRKLAMNEGQLKHCYAMALHMDDRHPHVHVVLKASARRAGGSTFGEQPSANGESSSLKIFGNSASL